MFIPKKKQPDLLLQEEHKKTSIFHGGVQYLERIHRALCLLNDVSLPSSSGETTIAGLSYRQHRERFHLLKILHRELYPKIAMYERPKHATMLDKLAGEFKSFETQLHKGGRTIPTAFIQTADTWELMLRDVIEENDLLMPDKAGAGEAINT